MTNYDVHVGYKLIHYETVVYVVLYAPCFDVQLNSCAVLCWVGRICDFIILEIFKCKKIIEFVLPCCSRNSKGECSEETRVPIISFVPPSALISLD